MNENSFRRVLLVDDDPDDVFIYRLALKEAGIDVDLQHVSCSPDLQSLLEGPPPDVIFLDLNLPQEDGLSCLESIRSVWPVEQVPVVIYSGIDQADTINRCFEKGAWYYLPKYQTVYALSEQLKYIFSSAHPERPAYENFYLGKTA